MKTEEAKILPPLPLIKSVSMLKKKKRNRKKEKEKSPSNVRGKASPMVPTQMHQRLPLTK